MATYDAQLLVSPASIASAGATPDAHDAQSLMGAGTVAYFKMRAIDAEGNGYVTWVVQSTPDFAGAQAPAPVNAGSPVVASTWEA